MADPVRGSDPSRGAGHPSQGQKPSLPYGWIVRQSSSYPDRVYYFNTVTGSSSWEVPKLVEGAQNEADISGTKPPQPQPSVNEPHPPPGAQMGPLEPSAYPDSPVPEQNRVNPTTFDPGRRHGGRTRVPQGHSPADHKSVYKSQGRLDPDSFHRGHHKSEPYYSGSPGFSDTSSSHWSASPDQKFEAQVLGKGQQEPGRGRLLRGQPMRVRGRFRGVRGGTRNLDGGLHPEGGYENLDVGEDESPNRFQHDLSTDLQGRCRGNPMPGRHHPMTGRGHPMLGRGYPMPGRSPPMPDRGYPMLDRGHIMRGRGRPMLGRGHPMPDRGHPMLDRGHPMTGRGHPMQGRGHPMLERGHPMMDRGHIMQRRGHPMPDRGHPMQDEGQVEDRDQSENWTPETFDRDEQEEYGGDRISGGVKHSAGTFESVFDSGDQTAGLGQQGRTRGLAARFRGRGQTLCNSRLGGNTSFPADYGPSDTDFIPVPNRDQFSASPVSLEDSNCRAPQRVVYHENPRKDLHSPDSFDTLDLERISPPGPADFDSLGGSSGGSLGYQPKGALVRDRAISPVEDIRLVSAPEEASYVLELPETRTGVTDSQARLKRKCSNSGGQDGPSYEPKRGTNSVWTTRDPVRSRTGGIKSRLGLTGRSQAYNPACAHIRSEDEQREALERFSDAPVPHSPTYAPSLSKELPDMPEKTVSRKSAYGDKKVARISPVNKKGEKRRTSDSMSETDVKKTKLAHSKVPSPKKSPKKRQDSKSQSPKRGTLLNDPLANRKKESRFSLSEDIVPAKHIYDTSRSSPQSQKKLKFKISNPKSKTVRLKRISEHDNSESRSKTGVSGDGSAHGDNDFLTNQEPVHRGHLNDLDKMASIQSWVNRIQDTPLSSSPDTTHSTLSVGSTLSDNDKFKTPLEAGPVSCFPVEANTSLHLTKDLSDSGYSTSTPVTGVTPGRVTETRDIVGMDIDEGDPQVNTDLQAVRPRIQANPDQYFGILTETFSSTDTSIQKVDVTGNQEASTVPDQLFIVLDTNVLMSHLDFVEELRDNHLTGFGRPTLVIPWVVLQELDALKNKQQQFPKLTWSTQAKARAPVHFLNKCFQSKHPRVKGQSSNEARTKLEGLDLECNDDRVLQCCLQWKEQYPKSQVILFTNDINLCTKAIVLSVQAVTRKTILTEINNLHVEGLTTSEVPVNSETEIYTPVSQPCVVSESNPVPLSPPTPQLHATPKSEGVPRDITPDKATSAKTKRESELQLADEMVCEMKTVLKDVLAHILEAEMKEAYDDLWTEIVLRKPPWSLRDLLDCYEKHWIAVFGVKLNRQLKETPVVSLQKHFKQDTGYGINIRQSCCLLDESLSLLDVLNSRKQYSSVVSEARTVLVKVKELGTAVLAGDKGVQEVPNLQVYLGKQTTPSGQLPTSVLSPSLEGSLVSLDTEEVSSSTSTHTLDQDDAEANLVKDKFHNTWVAIYNFCEELKRQAPMADVNLIRAGVLKRLPILKQLRTNFISAMSVKRRNIPQSMPQFAGLCSSLNAILPDVANNNEEKNLINANKLGRFFSKKANRSLLNAGLKQLDEMIKSLFVFVKQA